MVFQSCAFLQSLTNFFSVLGHIKDSVVIVSSHLRRGKWLRVVSVVFWK